MSLGLSEIEKLEGRELDAAVAEHVFDLETRRVVMKGRFAGSVRLRVSDGKSWWTCPDYSRDGDSALRVAKYMKKRYGCSLILAQLDNEWKAQFQNGKDGAITYHASPEVAICRAALVAARTWKSKAVSAVSDDLRAWLDSAKTILDVGDRALWAVQFGPALIAKVEELADELHHAIDHHVVRGDNRTVCVECGRIDGHALGCWVGEAEKALRAPGEVE